MTRNDLKELDRRRREVAQLAEQHAALCETLQRAQQALAQGAGDETAQQAVADKQRAQQALQKRLHARQRGLQARLHKLQQALCALPPAEREVLWLRYANGLKWDEIEQRVGYTRSYCYKLHARGVRGLYTAQEREVHENRRARLQQADRQQQVFARAVEALHAIAFDAPQGDEKPPTPAERMKAIEMLARLCHLFDAPDGADAYEADLSAFSTDELRHIAGL